MDPFYFLGGAARLIVSLPGLIVLPFVIFASSLWQRLIVSVIGGLVVGGLMYFRAMDVAKDLGIRVPSLSDYLAGPVVGFLLIALVSHGLALVLQLLRRPLKK